MLEERQEKQTKYELSIEAFKASLQQQSVDQKVKYEEQLLKLKETNYKQTIEIQGYQERNQILKEQLILFRERITELEKESLQQ